MTLNLLLAGATVRRAALARLDILPCDCPVNLSCPCGEACPPELAVTCPHCRGECNCLPSVFQPPCRHTLDAPQHTLSLDEWADLERLLDAAEYADPPAPPYAPAQALVLDLQGRIAVLVRRRRQHVGLWDERDLWNADQQARLRLVRVIVHGHNGRDEKDEYVAAER